MKLRIAYFCRNCNEEVDFKTASTAENCPFCGFLDDREAFGSIFYEWKVEERIN